MSSWYTVDKMLLNLLYEASGLSSKPVYRALTDWVVLKILDEVRQGQFVPDQRLSEEDLARRFEVSRAPVRDALHRLEQIGVVERRPPRGMYLRSWTDADYAEVLALLDALNLLAVQLSFGKLTNDDFVRLERIVEEAKAATATGTEEDRKQIQRDADFHLVLAKASGNRRLVQMMEHLMLPCVLYVSEAHDYLQRDFWVQMHGSLLEALRSGNLETAEARSISNARQIRDCILGHSHPQSAENAGSSSPIQVETIAPPSLNGASPEHAADTVASPSHDQLSA